MKLTDWIEVDPNDPSTLPSQDNREQPILVILADGTVTGGFYAPRHFSGGSPEWLDHNMRPLSREDLPVKAWMAFEIPKEVA